MTISEIKKEARASLKGKWGKAIKIVLAYSLLSFLVGLVQGFVGEKSLLYNIIDLAFTIISVPLSFGLIISFIKLKRDEDIKAFEFTKNGFSNFKKSLGITWHIFIRILLPMICIILVIILLLFSILFGVAHDNYILAFGIVMLYIATLIYVASRVFLYSVAYNVGYDNPELSSKDCVLKSEYLMKGNRGNIFLLELSFVGWAMLAAFTLGIGYLLLLPYIQVSLVCFYDKIVKTKEA